MFKRSNIQIARLLLIVVCLGLYNSNTYAQIKSSDVLELHLLDVGYGACVLLRLPGGDNLLIDGGDTNAGKKVLRYLKKNKIKTLHSAVVTHPHQDHQDGLAEVVRKKRPGVLIAASALSIIGYEKLYAVAVKKNLKFRRVIHGDVLVNAGSVALEVLNPKTFSGDWNADSLVLMFTYKKIKCLLASDITDERCLELVKRYGKKIGCDVLVLPHHGQSGGGTFLKVVRPRYVLISTGKNQWGGPDARILGECAELQATVLRTDQRGDIIITSNGETITWESQK